MGSVVDWRLNCFIYRSSCVAILISSQIVTYETNNRLRRGCQGGERGHQQLNFHVLDDREFRSHSPRALLPTFVSRELPRVDPEII